MKQPGGLRLIVENIEGVADMQTFTNPYRKLDDYESESLNVSVR